MPSNKNLYNDISQAWDNHIIPTLIDYIKIPNKSPDFDPHWKQHGYMDQAMQLLVAWCKKQPIKAMALEVIQTEDRTPLLFIEIPGQIDETVLLYGHMDKQPEMTGWDPDLGPWKPVLKGENLYGRGSADDGYSVFAALTAIATLQRHHIPHGRCIVIIEGSEESASPDLIYYLKKLQGRIGKTSLVICLDTGCGNYEQMWASTSLRGLISGVLTIDVTTQGVHSGVASGIVPSTFLILRQLLDRIEDSVTGQIILKDLITEIPPHRLEQAKHTAATIRTSVYRGLPFISGVKPLTDDVAELLLNQTWRPQLSVTGIDGLPPVGNAGNVTVPNVAVKLSVRLPPTCDAQKAIAALKNTLEKNPPFNAKITFQSDLGSNGWQTPTMEPWLKNANEAASLQFFNKPAAYMGEGGSIPFMGMLGTMYPKAQFLITGVLGPQSNAHGPNEFLHIPTAKKITGCVAFVLAAHYEQFK